MGKLAELENKNKYVFHGSGLLIEEFEPRQAYNFINGKQIPDGEPAVFASPFSNYAIFMALINKVNCPKGHYSSCGYDDGKLIFKATKETLEQLGKDTKGYVYVFDREDFVERSGHEWLSYKKIKPAFSVIVTLADFVPNIEEMDSI